MTRKVFYFLLLAPMLGCQNALTPDVVAVVNGQKVMTREWEETVSKLSQSTPKNFTDPQAKKEVLAGVIDRELLFQKALKEKVYMNSVYLKDQIVQEYLRQTIGLMDAEPTESEIQGAYEQKKAEFERVDASHILIKDEAAAKSVLAKLRAEKRPDFARYARQYSQDPGSKDRGGELGVFRKKDMVPAFSEAAFSLAKPGDISDLVKTQFGFHIIRLNARVGDLDALRADLKQDLIVEKRKKAVDALLNKLRTSASIELNEAALAGGKS